MRALTIEEQRLFLKTVKGTDNYNQFALLLQTGLRTGELSGLCWQDVDFEMRTLHIRRTTEYRYSVREWKIGEPKIKNSVRDVPLTQEAIDILNNQKEKLLQKAMVFTLAASMLVGTPLTASAAGIRGVYSISDGTGTWNDHDSGSGTGTVTNTDTNSDALIEDGDAKIIGIVLDKQNMALEKNDKEPLRATVILDGEITATKELKEEKLTDGRSDEYTALLKHTVDLSECLIRTPSTASDTITWISTDTKVATVNAKGKVTFKKLSTGSIIAVGERGGDAKVEYRFEVSKGMAATKIETIDEEDNPWKNAAVKLTGDGTDNGDESEKIYPYVKMSVKMKGVIVHKDNPKKPATSEDEFAYKNGKVVTGTVDVPDGETFVTVDADGTVHVLNKGTVTITAKTPQGKKGTLKVIVKDLTLFGAQTTN